MKNTYLKGISRWRQLMCCSCKNKWNRKSPLFCSLLIPLTLILIFVYFCSQCSWLLLLPAACVMVLWWLLVYSLFPRIVVTIKSIKDIKEFKDPDQFQSLKLYVNGRCVYNVDEDPKDHWPPTQFAFYVWKRGIYKLLLVSNTNESAIETANTYEHAVCNVVFGNNAKGN